MTSLEKISGTNPPTGGIQQGEVSRNLTTADEVATVLSITKRSVYEATRKGVIPCYRIQRQVRFDLDEVLAACKVKRFPVQPPPDDSYDEEEKAS